MLVELRAENYAVIDHAIAVFGPGLNLLTGETGAGKSILVDALTLLMGGKASTELVRHGADKATVSCVFDSTPAADQVLEENGIDSEGTEIILRREILQNGKGRVFVNNQPAAVAVLKQLAPELALVHSQTETLSSFDQAQQRTLLDRFGGISTEAVAQAYTRWHTAQQKLRELEEGEQDRLRWVDLWSYQSNEIQQAHLIAGENEALETEKRVLANSEKLYAAAISAFEQLYEGEASAESSLRAAKKNVEELARYDSKFAEAVQQLESARATVGDLGASLRDYAEGINASPERLAEIEDRLAALDRLKRKYGKTIDEVIAFGEDVARKLAEVEDREGLLKTLRAELASAADAYRAAATKIHAERKAAAGKLAKLAEAQINSLAMKVRFAIDVRASEDGTGPDRPASEKISRDAGLVTGADRTASAKTSRDAGLVTGADRTASAKTSRDAGLVTGHDFSRADNPEKNDRALAPAKAEALKGHDFSRAERIEKNERALAPETSWTSTGWDQVEYRIATNPGEPMKPLHEIASGGEMSRVMLALKVTVEESAVKPKKKQPTPRTLVFDEIDIGIGGRAAEAVGQKLKALSKGQQVLCVTHLPQIAAFADQHFLIDKREVDGRTKTQVRLLDDRARTHEVARMLSGAKVTETSLQHAGQMIASSR